MSRLFEQVPRPRVPRSVFNLSYDKSFTCDIGQLIPVMCDEVIPGDVFKIGYEAVVRAAPMVAPILHPLNMVVEYFFVPNRILDEDWTTIITGGVDGDDETSIPTYSSSVTVNSLSDYIGIPPGVTPDGANWIRYPRWAYNKIYNEYYRDETLQNEISEDSNDILNRDWRKDYFTSALDSQLRGTALALPVSGVLEVEPNATGIPQFQGTDSTDRPLQVNADASIVLNGYAGAQDLGLDWGTPNLEVDLSGATTFDVADQRLAFQITKWQERNNRFGVRYTEFLQGHYGVSPRDDRLDRPEFIGGSRAPIIISEVLQTSQSDTTPQGHMAGHGIGVDKRNIGKYRVKEFGIIMGLMSIMPKAMYSQGIDRQWLREDRYDFYSPEFANLSEQAILNREIFVTTGNSSLNQTIFGYQGRFDEMRHKRSMVVGDMRGGQTFDYWNLARTFSSVPTLGDTFLQCDATNDDLKRNFEDEETNGWFVHFGNKLKAIRPLPAFSNPGLIDH